MLEIGSNTFKTKNDATEYYKKIMNNIGVCESIRNETLYFEEIHSLIKRHPCYSEKCKDMCDFKLIRNRLNPNALELNVINECGYVIDISWRICISGINKTLKSELNSALRYAITDQIISFRNLADKSVCALCYRCLTKSDEIHIDHVIHFAKLTKDFNESIPHDKIPSVFADANDDSNRRMFMYEDSEYMEAWQEYHQRNCVLRVVCKRCNLTRQKYKDLSLLI